MILFYAFILIVFYLNKKPFHLSQVFHQNFQKNHVWTDHEKMTFAFFQQWFSSQKIFTLSTSGTTDTPQKITITRQQMIASAYQTRHYLPLKKVKHVLIPIHTAYIGGWMMMVRSLIFGWTMHIVDPCKNPLSYFVKNIIPFDFAALVPLQLYTILQQSSSVANNVLNRMQAIIVGGAPITYALHKLSQRIKSPIFHTYGMTETVTHIAMKKINGYGQQKCYHVLSRVSIKKNEKGCLVVRPCAITAFKTIITRDLIHCITTHIFSWIGRYDHMVNSGGHKIMIEVVEKKIATIFHKYSLQSDFFLKAIPDEKLGEQLVLAVAHKRLSTIVKKKIYEHCIKKIPRYSIPKKIYYITHCPKINEKINRNINLQLYPFDSFS